MSVSIKINAGDDHPFALEIDGFPTQIHLDKSDKIMVILPFGLFIAVGLFLMFDMITALTMSTVIVAFFVFAFSRSTRQFVLDFESDRVLVLEPGLFRDRQWQAYYSEYEGVFLRTRRARSRASKTTYQIIELQHIEPQKTLPLYVEKSIRKPKAQWKAYASLFGVSAKTS